MTLLYFGSAGKVLNVYEYLQSLKVPSFVIGFKGLQLFQLTSKPRFLAAVPVKNTKQSCTQCRRGFHSFFRYRRSLQRFQTPVSIAFTQRKARLELLRAVERAAKASSTIVEQLIVERLCLIAAPGGVVKPVSCIKLGASRTAQPVKVGRATA